MGARRRITSACCLLPPAFCLLLAAGCRSNCDLVEAELRGRDRDLRQLRDELNRQMLCNDALQRELRALKRNCPGRALPEDASLILWLKSVSLGRQTGGYDDDASPGDEALQVVLEPRDVDDQVIKVPGTLEVQALEVNTEGLKKPLGSWLVSPEQLRRNWRSGILSTGYFVVLPWKNWPCTEKLRVGVRFTLADGRVFEADKDVSIRLTPASRRRPALGDPLVTPPSVPAEQGPPPRRLDPPPGGEAAAQPVGGAVQILPPRPRPR